jgi:hypothetical protein
MIAHLARLRPAVTKRGGVDLFPVLHAERQLVVVGFDDRHLDFRVLVELTSSHVRCTTAVRRHNHFGRLYFAVVRGAHKRLVPHLLSRASERGWTPGPDAPPGCPIRPTITHP